MTKTSAVNVITGNNLRPKLVCVVDRTGEQAERKKSLDKLEAALKSANTSIGEGFWDLGCFAKSIKVQELYQAAGFNRFADYCRERLHISESHVQNAIRVSETMSREDAGAFGVTCATAIARSPDSARDEIVSMVESGVAPHTVAKTARKRAQAERVKAGKTPVGRKPGKTQNVSGGKAKVARDGECVTITFNAAGVAYVIRLNGDCAEWEAV